MTWKIYCKDESPREKRLDLWLCIIQEDRSLEKIFLWIEIKAWCNMLSQKYVKCIICNESKYHKILSEGQCQPPHGRVVFINFC